ALHCLRNPLQRPRLRSCFRPRCRRGDLLHRHRDFPAPYRIYPVRGVLMTSALAPAPSKLAAERKKSADRGRRLGSRTGNTIAGIAAWAIGILFVFPVFYMVLTSLHSEANLSTTLVILLEIPAASALSVKPIKKWTDAMFFFLSTKMLPAVAGLLPLYIFAKYLGLLDNINYLLILYTAMNLPIAVWMMRSFLADIPVELFEAAAMDGAGLIRTLRSIIVPIISPGIAATALICFIFAWNELLLANTLTSVIAGTAPVYLTSFVTSQGLFLAKVCAAATVVSLPVIIAGFAAQDKLVQGLSLGAVK